MKIATLLISNSSDLHDAQIHTQHPDRVLNLRNIPDNSGHEEPPPLSVTIEIALLHRVITQHLKVNVTADIGDVTDPLMLEEESQQLLILIPREIALVESQ